MPCPAALQIALLDVPGGTGSANPLRIVSQRLLCDILRSSMFHLPHTFLVFICIFILATPLAFRGSIEYLILKVLHLLLPALWPSCGGDGATTAKAGSPAAGSVLEKYN